MNYFVNSVLLALAAATMPAAAIAGEVPELVSRLAQDYLASPSADASVNQGEEPVQVYADNFFRGLTHPGGGVYTQSGLVRDAYTRGQAYWREHPDEYEHILAGYGYTKVKTEGQWSRGFEQSRFIPEDRPGETWWVSSFGGVRWTDLGPGQADARFATARVHLTGYLSPAGRHGHVGQYTRELLATGFTIDAEGTEPGRVIATAAAAANEAKALEAMRRQSYQTAILWFRQGLAELGDVDMGNTTHDDTRMKFTLADIVEKEGKTEQAAHLPQGVFGSRMAHARNMARAENLR